MDRPPRGAEEGILVRERQRQIVWQGALITMAGLLVWGFAEYVQTGYTASHVQTMLFSTMVLTQLLHAFDFRSETRTVWSKESLRNRWLVYAVLGSFVLQLFVIYVPFLQRLFSTEALLWQDWAAILVAAIIAVSIIDLVKVTLARRRAAERG
jgi:Ca2+-transporting ATPase